MLLGSVLFKIFKVCIIIFSNTEQKNQNKMHWIEVTKNLCWVLFESKDFVH